MSYIDKIKYNVNMPGPERRERYDKFVEELEGRVNAIVKIDLIAVMAFCGEFNFSKENRAEFIKDFNTLSDVDVMVELSQQDSEDFYSRAIKTVYVMRRPKGYEIAQTLTASDESIFIKG